MSALEDWKKRFNERTTHEKAFRKWKAQNSSNHKKFICGDIRERDIRYTPPK